MSVQVPLMRAVLKAPDDIVALRRRGRQLCERLGIEPMRATRFCTALSELGRVLLEAGGGAVTLGVSPTDRRLVGTAVGPELDAKAMSHVAHLGAVKQGVVGLEVSCELPADAKVDRGHLSRVASPIANSVGAADTLDEVLVQQRELLHAMEERDQREKRLRELTRSLAEQRQKLRRSNADLERFAAAASHDLKAPLAVINTYAMVLERVHAGQDSAVYVDGIQQAAKRLGDMLAGLLEWSKVEAADADVVTDTYEVVAEVVHDVLAANADADLDIRCEGELPPMRVARVHLVQIIQNFIGNAVKYRAERPLVVRVRAQHEGAMIRLSVEDNGMGVPAEARRDVFELFKRLSRDDGRPGTGVGLALVARLADRYQGAVDLENVPSGGSIFSITLPAATEAPAR